MTVARVLSALLVAGALGACSSQSLTGPQQDGVFLSADRVAPMSGKAARDTTALWGDGGDGQSGYIVAYTKK